MDDYNLSVRLQPGIHRPFWKDGQSISYTDDGDDASALPKVPFDHAFGPEENNQDIFEQVILPAIGLVLKGQNATVLVYGADQSGKRYTMEGVAKHPGVIALALVHLLRMTRLQLCWLEVAQERVNDLLGLREDISGWADVRRVTVKSAASAFAELGKPRLAYDRNSSTVLSLAVPSRPKRRGGTLTFVVTLGHSLGYLKEALGALSRGQSPEPRGALLRMVGQRMFSSPLRMIFTLSGREEHFEASMETLALATLLMWRKLHPPEAQVAGDVELERHTPLPNTPMSVVSGRGFRRKLEPALSEEGPAAPAPGGDELERVLMDLDFTSQELQRSREQEANTRRALEHTRREVLGLEAQNALMIRQVASLEKTEERLGSANTRLVAGMEELQERLENSQKSHLTEVQDLREQVAQEVGSARLAERKLAEAEARIAQLSKALEEARAEAKEARLEDQAKLQQATSSLRQCVASRDETVQLLEKMQKAYSESSGRMQSLLDKFQGQQRSLTQCQADLATAELRLSKAQEQVRSQASHVASLEERLAARNAKTESLERDLQKREVLLLSLEKVNREMEKQLESQQDTIDRQVSRYGELMSELELSSRALLSQDLQQSGPATQGLSAVLPSSQWSQSRGF